jgi:hypothetical protein
MAAKLAGIAKMMGVPPESIEGDFRIRRPDDPLKVKHSHDKEMLVLWLTGILSVSGCLLALALCWLFLDYGKPEQAEKVVALVIGMIGGIGLGRTTVGKD